MNGFSIKAGVGAVLALAMVFCLQTPAQAKHYEIVCVGDSITEGTYPQKLSQMLAQYMPGQNTFSLADHGMGGQKTVTINDAMVSEGWLNGDPDFVLILSGTNNVLHGYFEGGNLDDIAGATLREMQMLVNNARRSTHRKIIVAVMPPTLDRGLTEWVDYVNRRYVNELTGVDAFVQGTWKDFYDENTGTATSALMRDRLHPNLAGNWILSRDWFRAIRVLIQSDESSDIKSLAMERRDAMLNQEPAPR